MEMNIQWYPGHMTKTRRMIAENLKQVDAVCEILDARIPISSRIPDADELTRGKPRLIILNRVDQADPSATAQWVKYFKDEGVKTLQTNSKSGAGVKEFADEVMFLLKDKLDGWKQKGQKGRKLRVMIIGVPNVGKSSFINRLAGRKTAKTEDRPGVTRGRQWIGISSTLELMDTPGILWPKFESQSIGLNLAYTGAVKDEIMDLETLAASLCNDLALKYPNSLKERYEISPKAEDTGFELLEQCAKKRGFLIYGGEPDVERMARVILDEFRAGKLGRITLEVPVV